MSLLISVSSYTRDEAPQIPEDHYDPARQVSRAVSDPLFNLTDTQSESTTNYGRDPDKDDSDQD
jgi:hypothetical protein